MPAAPCRPLTVLGREGVVGGVQAQDGDCRIVEFVVRAGVEVIVGARFITEQQGGEAFVKLADGLRLDQKGKAIEDTAQGNCLTEEKRTPTFKTWSISTTFSRTFLCLRETWFSESTTPL